VVRFLREDAIIGLSVKKLVYKWCLVGIEH